MPAARMHADEVDADASLVWRLLAAQFPQWADLPIEPVPSAGTDNALYRLGDDRVVRLPRRPAATAQVDKEHRWLPKLAPLLPLAIPVPLARGEPGGGYPWRWSVYRWLDGEIATVERLADRAAIEIAQFVAALQAIDATGGPLPGRHNFFRGVPLALRDPFTRGHSPCSAISSTSARRPPRGTRRSALPRGTAGPSGPRRSAARKPPVGRRAALRGRRLRLSRRRRSGRDCIVAWNFFSGEAREAFRAALAVDDATWARGRGWALSTSLIALPYYHTTNPRLAAISQRTIDEVLGDCERAA
jgi:aminoglycoside phosphotransferase (APT) family kinase protein